MSKPIVSLNLMVDKSSGRLIFAESNSHFADILLSFLTIPLSSILRLTANSTTSLGSINNLFSSVQNLTGDCFHSEACRAMLLQPMNSASNLLPPLRINYDTGSHRVCSSYLCNDRSCYAKGLSFYANARCTCGKIMDRSEHFVADQSHVLSSAGHKSGVFLEDSFRLTITDDLRIFQSSSEVSIDLLAKLDINQSSSIEAVHVDVTIEKIHELLNRMLVSDTPLTDVFLGVGSGGSCEGVKPQINEDGVKQQINESHSETTAVEQTSTKRISIKFYLNKRESEVLFIEADKDFAEFLASFLTFPIGSVVTKLGGKSGFRCLVNIFNSIKGLEAANCFRIVTGLVEMLLKPMLPPFFCLKDNNLLNIDEQAESGTRYYTCRTDWCESNAVRTVANVMCKSCETMSIKRLTLVNPKCGGEYMRSSKYMVEDNLVMKQFSSVMVADKILEGAGEGGIVVRNVEIGEEEALLLLQASVTSKNVLTDAFLVKNKRRRRRNYI